jgi:hypothetical protein
MAGITIFSMVLPQGGAACFFPQRVGERLIAGGHFLLEGT